MHDIHQPSITPPPEPKNCEAPLSNRGKEFVRTLTVEKVQQLARSLLCGSFADSEVEQMISTAHEEVVQALKRTVPEREKDLQFLADVVGALHALPPGDPNNSYAEDIFCSDISRILQQNQELHGDFTFAHNLLSTIQRLKKHALQTDERSADKDAESNEEFLLKDPEQLAVEMLDSKREFWHLS